MAHEIESMAYAGATPWHRLGKKVEGDATRNGSDFMIAAGMDWEAHKKPLYIKDDNGDFQVTQDSFAVVRNKTPKPITKEVQYVDLLKPVRNQPF